MCRPSKKRLLATIDPPIRYSPGPPRPGAPSSPRPERGMEQGDRLRPALTALAPSTAEAKLDEALQGSGSSLVRDDRARHPVSSILRSTRRTFARPLLD